MSRLISVIVPVYNVEDYLRECVDSILKQEYKDYEVILVDDGSSDNTAQEAMKAGAIVISHEVNKGKGEALYTGYKNAECDIIINELLHELITWQLMLNNTLIL